MSSLESKIEETKRLAAKRAVSEHFSASYTHVGIGSGTTIIYVVEAIKEALGAHSSAISTIQFIPTGYQSRQVILKAGLTPRLFDSLPDDVVLDVAFDGADEVDEDLNCIKGGGACLFQEKLVAVRAKKFVCVAGTWSHFPASPVFHRHQTNPPSIATRLPQSQSPPFNSVAHNPD